MTPESILAFQRGDSPVHKTLQGVTTLQCICTVGHLGVMTIRYIGHRGVLIRDQEKLFGKSHDSVSFALVNVISGGTKYVQLVSYF